MPVRSSVSLSDIALRLEFRLFEPLEPELGSYISIYDVEVTLRDVRLVFDAVWNELGLGEPEERATRGGGTIEEVPQPQRPEVVEIRRGSLELLLSLPGAFVAGAGAITAVIALAERIFNLRIRIATEHMRLEREQAEHRVEIERLEAEYRRLQEQNSAAHEQEPEALRAVDAEIVDLRDRPHSES